MDRVARDGLRVRAGKPSDEGDKHNNGNVMITDVKIELQRKMCGIVSINFSLFACNAEFKGRLLMNPRE